MVDFLLGVAEVSWNQGVVAAGTFEYTEQHGTHTLLYSVELF